MELEVVPPPILKLTRRVKDLHPTSGLMEACVPTDNCSFGRRTIPTRKISQEFDAMRFPAIPSPTEDGNYACVVLHTQNAELSCLRLGGLTEPSSAGTVFNQCMQNLECSSSSEKQKKTSQENQTSSEVHPEPNSKSVPTRVSTDRADMAATITGTTSPSLLSKL
ncbi:hypothetical protein Tco_1122504 [Tanacetum coccineum]|uniref:Uncharacterized protein n=1 Tax=Tanacetum coccineum TaxID=301880 RepID=A0ABQ5J4F6_9ASTR